LILIKIKKTLLVFTDKYFAKITILLNFVTLKKAT